MEKRPSENLCPYCFKPLKDAKYSCSFCSEQRQSISKLISQALPVGSTLDSNHYTLGMALGQSDSKISYLAWDSRLRFRVVIKEYFPSKYALRKGNSVFVEHGNDQKDFDDGLDLFLKEARLLAKFQFNPIIVGVSVSFIENGTAYYVMEYIEGTTLGKSIQNHPGGLNFQETTKILSPVMNELTALQHEKLWHQEILPENIILTADGKIRLADFGIGKGSKQHSSHDSQENEVNHCFSPLEPYNILETQDERADVYSLGAVYYYALTGEYPISADSRSAGSELKSPNQYKTHINFRISHAIMKAMELNPKNRWRTIEEFQKALSFDQFPFVRNGIIFFFLCILILFFFRNFSSFKNQPGSLFTPQQITSSNEPENSAIIPTGLINNLTPTSSLTDPNGQNKANDSAHPGSIIKLQFTSGKPSAESENQFFPSIAAALNSLPAESGDVILSINDGYEETQDISLPTDKGISSFTIAPADLSKAVNINFSDHALFLNGIPGLISEGVKINNFSIFGGSPAINGDSIQLTDSKITIRGSLSEGMVYGGGKASGPGSFSSVTNTSLEISGKNEYTEGKNVWIFGGGLASSGSSAEAEHASIALLKSSFVNYYILAGGNSKGHSCSSLVKNASLTIDGYAENVCAGGKASLIGSSSTVNQAEIYGRGGNNYGGGYAEEGGKAIVEKASFFPEVVSVYNYYSGGISNGKRSQSIVEKVSFDFYGSNSDTDERLHDEGLEIDGGIAEVNSTDNFHFLKHKAD